MVEVIFSGPEFDDDGIAIPETIYGKKLKKFFDNEFKDKKHINGKISIQSCVQIFGADTRDFDIIVSGYFENLYQVNAQDIRYKFLTKDKKAWKSEYVKYSGDVRCKNFCFIIEVKSHEARALRLSDHYNLEVLMTSKRGKRYYHDATNQSEQQKWTLKNYLENKPIRFIERNGKPKNNIDVANFIWLVNVNNEDMKKFYHEKVDRAKTQNFGNILPSDIKSFSNLFKASLALNLPTVWHNKKHTPTSSCVQANSTEESQNIFDDIFKILTEKRVLQEGMTRRRVEQISRSFLKKQKYFEEINDKLTIISGRPGTGKTIKLLRIAMDLTTNHNSRCLFLTYNKALASDIKRTLHHTSLRKVDDKIVVKTFHKFFYDLLKDFEIISDHPEDFLANYEKYLIDIKEYIETGAISSEDIAQIKIEHSIDIAFDHILVDEGQDSNVLEKDILFELFGQDHIIVSEGPNQMVRSERECVWEEGISRDDYNKVSEKIGLRQKSNLVHFVSSFAKSRGLDWSVDAKEDLLGGNITISNQDYSTNSDHEKIQERCIEDGNEPYDMMLLIPSKYAVKKLSDNNIKFWDGTDSELRFEYSDKLDENRLFRYQSCRGLEGWSVSCIEFDTFVEGQIKVWDKDKQSHKQKNMFTSDKEKRELFAYSWATMAMTRAIDTIHITLKNKESDVGKLLYRIYEKNKDFITWID